MKVKSPEEEDEARTRDSAIMEAAPSRAKNRAGSTVASQGPVLWREPHAWAFTLCNCHFEILNSFIFESGFCKKVQPDRGACAGAWRISWHVVPTLPPPTYPGLVLSSQVPWGCQCGGVQRACPTCQVTGPGPRCLWRSVLAHGYHLPEWAHTKQQIKTPWASRPEQGKSFWTRSPAFSFLTHPWKLCHWPCFRGKLRHRDVTPSH